MTEGPSVALWLWKVSRRNAPPGEKDAKMLAGVTAQAAKATR